MSKEGTTCVIKSVHPTIARIWRGRTRREVADEYEANSSEVGIKPLIEKAMGVQTFREDRAEEKEFITISYWESFEAMSRFTGGEPTHIRHLDRDPELLIELPSGVQILRIVTSHGNTQESDRDEAATRAMTGEHADRSLSRRTPVPASRAGAGRRDARPHPDRIGTLSAAGLGGAAEERKWYGQARVRNEPVPGRLRRPYGVCDRPALFRHFIEEAQGQTGSVYGRHMYEVMRYWDDDHPEWDAEERAFAATWRNQPKWVVSRSLKSVGPNARLVEDDLEGTIRELKAERDGEIEVAGPDLARSLTELRPDQ